MQGEGVTPGDNSPEASLNLFAGPSFGHSLSCETSVLPPGPLLGGVLPISSCCQHCLRVHHRVRLGDLLQARGAVGAPWVGEPVHLGVIKCHPTAWQGGAWTPAPVFLSKG